MNSQRINSNYSLLVFVFFIAGGIVVSLIYADFPNLWSAQPLTGAYGLLIVPVGLSFFLAMTVFGVFLLPFCSLSCGALIAYLAQSMLSSGNDYSEYRDICAFLCVLVPAFFVVCSGGMQTSSLVREAVVKARPQVKKPFRLYILAAAAAAAAVGLAGYIINKI